MPFVEASRGMANAGLENTDIMPSSLSQVDTSVLQQLPKELRVDIIEQLPAHRKPGLSANSSLSPSKHPLDPVDNIHSENHLDLTYSASKYKLWVGNPPKWVDEFSESNCVILNVLAKMYYKSGSTGSLSSILRCTMMESRHLLDAGNESWNEALQGFSEVLKQYVNLKIELDIEELYICFRLLQRYEQSAYLNIIPHIQLLKLQPLGSEKFFFKLFIFVLNSPCYLTVKIC